MQVVLTTHIDFLEDPLDFLDSPKYNKPSFPKKTQLPQRTTHSWARKRCHFLAYTYFHANFISIDMIFKVHPKFKYYVFERGFITKFTFLEHHQFNVTSSRDITIHPFIMEELKSMWWCNLVIMTYPNFDGNMLMVKHELFMSTRISWIDVAPIFQHLNLVPFHSLVWHILFQIMSLNTHSCIPCSPSSFLTFAFEAFTMSTTMIDCKFGITSVKSIKAFDARKANVPKTNFACLYWVHSWLVHKRNVSPQNHYHDTTLNDHYVYEIIYLVDFLLPLDNHILLD